jgi:argininosuccinate lyase
VPLDQLPDDAVQALDPAFGDDWRSVFDLQRALAARERPGMPGPGQTQSQIQAWRVRLG